MFAPVYGMPCLISLLTILCSSGLRVVGGARSRYILNILESGILESLFFVQSFPRIRMLERNDVSSAKEQL